jgi:hypothetical protein
MVGKFHVSRCIQALVTMRVGLHEESFKKISQQVSRHVISSGMCPGLLVFSMVANATVPVGTTPGAFAVSPSGAAIYFTLTFRFPSPTGCLSSFRLTTTARPAMGWHGGI